MMTFILTQTEGKASIPVGVTASEKIAKEWFVKTPGNDFYPLEMDRVEHLGFAANGPAFVAPPPAAPPVRFVMPVVPVITPDMSPAKASKKLAEYLVKLSEAMELIQRALDA